MEGQLCYAYIRPENNLGVISIIPVIYWEQQQKKKKQILYKKAVILNHLVFKNYFLFFRYSDEISVLHISRVSFKSFNMDLFYIILYTGI